MKPIYLVAMVPPMAFATLPAKAHIGDHSNELSTELLSHLLGPSHLLLLAFALACVCLALAAHRVAKRQQIKQDRANKGRQS